MKIFVIFFFVAKSVLAQDTGSITQAELLHRTQIMYDAVATGVKAPWQQYLAGDAIIHDEKGASYTKPTFLATVEPLPSGYSGTIKVTIRRRFSLMESQSSATTWRKRKLSSATA
jgi:hypothetical protein